MAGPLGYDDTPIISGHQYRVHDCERPQPRVVTPPTASTQDQPGSVPSDAVVLFDGADGSGWVSAKDGSDNPWKIDNGYMEVVPGTGDIASTQPHGSCQLHLEFAEPSEIKGESQGRGNSGVFLMSQYEIQVLDCYENPTYADGSTAAIYGEYPPHSSLNYIWANRVYPEAVLANTYTAQAQMFLLQKGAARAGVWVEESRNILEDYRRAFGEEPPETATVAIMADADNTGGKVRAWVDDLVVFR